MSQSIVWLSYGVLFLFLFLVILAGYMMLDAHRYQQKLRRIDHYMKQYNNDCYAYFIAGDDTRPLTFQHDEKCQAITYILESYVAYVQDVSIFKRIQRYAEAQYASTYRKLLRSYSTPKRLNVLYRIFSFQMKSLLPDVKTLLSKRISRRERVEALKIVAKLDETSIETFYMQQRARLHDGEIEVIVSCLSDDMIYQIVDQMHEDTRWLRAALKVMNRRQLQDGSTAVHALLQHEDRQVRLAAVRILSTIGTTEPLRTFESLFTSEDPIERQLFSKMAVHYPIEATYDYMYALAQDKVFDVRAEAIKSLTNYANHQSIFRRMLASLDDLYTTEMIQAYMSGELVNDAVH